MFEDFGYLGWLEHLVVRFSRFQGFRMGWEGRWGEERRRRWYVGYVEES